MQVEVGIPIAAICETAWNTLALMRAAPFAGLLSTVRCCSSGRGSSSHGMRTAHLGLESCMCVSLETRYGLTKTFNGLSCRLR